MDSYRLSTIGGTLRKKEAGAHYIRITFKWIRYLEVRRHHPEQVGQIKSFIDEGILAFR